MRIGFRFRRGSSSRRKTRLLLFLLETILPKLTCSGEASLESVTIRVEGIYVLGRTESTRKRPTQEVNIFACHGGATKNGWTFVAYLISIGTAASTGLIIGLALSLSTAESVALASSASALTGGLLFSILELRKSPAPAKRMKPLTYARCSTQTDLNAGLRGSGQSRSPQRLTVANESDGISRVARRYVPTA